jgi:hypothetical protein
MHEKVSRFLWKEKKTEKKVSRFLWFDSPLLFPAYFLERRKQEIGWRRWLWRDPKPVLILLVRELLSNFIFIILHLHTPYKWAPYIIMYI